MNKVDKSDLRRKILAERRSLLPPEVEQRSLLVLDNLFESGILEGQETVALYAAADREVLTRPLFERLVGEGQRVVLPRVRGRGPQIDFFPVRDWSRLEVSRLSIPEPSCEGEPMVPEKFDLVVVPGIAFDCFGGRIGYGMGCYDRVLARTRPRVPLIGIGYDFQLVDRVPRERHDIALTGVIVESKIVLPTNARSD